MWDAVFIVFAIFVFLLSLDYINKCWPSVL